MMGQTHTHGPWKTKVVCASAGLESSGYAHQVVIGIHDYTVAHTTHRNYDHVVHEPLPDGYVRSRGVGRREPDLTPHPDALLIAAAPDLLHACERVMQLAVSAGSDEIFVDVRAAIAKAKGEAVR